MNLTEYFRSSLDALRTNKLRSGLSLIGIVVGVASVVVLVGLGNGMKEKIIKSYSSTNNIITIASGPDYSMSWTPSSSTPTTPTTEPYEVIVGKKLLFSESMIEQLRGMQFPNIRAIVPVFNSISASTFYRGKSIYANTLPLTDDFQRARNLQIKRGTFFSEKSLAEKEKVAIVGFGTIENTFGKENPIGKTLAINGQIFTIGGILERTGDYNVDQTIFIPLSIAKSLFGLKSIARIEVVTEDTSKIKETQAFFRELLDRYFGAFAGQIYHFETNERLLREMNKMINSMTLFIASIAGISLLVGGIGIMNVMLVSVTERTREIGIRKAIGATRFDILTQFLIESGVITGIGGVMALIISSLIGLAITKFVPVMAFSMGLPIVMIATGFSILMGVIFGILPAWKAAKMNTIDALRFE